MITYALDSNIVSYFLNKDETVRLIETEELLCWIKTQ
jgi:hypothetical protein